MIAKLDYSQQNLLNGEPTCNVRDSIHLSRSDRNSFTLTQWKKRCSIVSSDNPQFLQRLVSVLDILKSKLLVPRILWIIRYWSQTRSLSLISSKQMVNIFFHSAWENSFESALDHFLW